MDRCVVVVIGNNKARFFTLEQAEWPEYESGPNLVEQESLSPSTSNYSQRFWSVLIGKSDRKKTSKDRSRSGLTEHHYQFERKFARQITSQIVTWVRITQSPKLVLVAPSPILNLVNKFFLPTLFANLQIEEIPKDISYFTCDRIHQYLAQKQIIPACEKIVYPR